MNYSTEVKFSNNLIKKGKTTIIYSGSLFRIGSESITLVYGFGDNWEHTTEKEMIKNENNFSVEIELLDYDKINFCFRNSDNVWDNNNYLDYTSSISEPEEEYNFIINENLIEKILNPLLEIDLSISNNINTYKSKISKDQNCDSSIELVDNSIDIEESFDIEIPKDEPNNMEDFLVNNIEAPSLTNDLEVAFYSLFEESKDQKKEEIVNFDMNSLIDEILSPILESEELNNQNYQKNVNLKKSEINKNIFDNVKQEEIQNTKESLSNNPSLSETSLIEVNPQETSFLVSARSLSKFYILKKRIKLAIYKFFTAIPKIIQANFNESKNQ